MIHGYEDLMPASPRTVDTQREHNQKWEIWANEPPEKESFGHVTPQTENLARSNLRTAEKP
jgi:hypothetical protein